MTHVMTASGLWALRPSTRRESFQRAIEGVIASALWAAIYAAPTAILGFALLGGITVIDALLAFV